jgi:hypothetical protein
MLLEVDIGSCEGRQFHTCCSGATEDAIVGRMVKNVVGKCEEDRLGCTQMRPRYTKVIGCPGLGEPQLGVGVKLGGP